jgi:hypothetical protein
MRFGSKRCSLSDQRARPILLLDCGTVPTTLNGSGEAPYAGLVGPDPKEERFFDIFTRHAHLAHNAMRWNVGTDLVVSGVRPRDAVGGLLSGAAFEIYKLLC